MRTNSDLVYFAFQYILRQEFTFYPFFHSVWKMELDITPGFLLNNIMTWCNVPTFGVIMSLLEEDYHSNNVGAVR